MQTPTFTPLHDVASPGVAAPPNTLEQDRLPEPDWDTESDEAFLEAARAVFAENAELLRRLA